MYSKKTIPLMMSLSTYQCSVSVTNVRIKWEPRKYYNRRVRSEESINTVHSRVNYWLKTGTSGKQCWCCIINELYKQVHDNQTRPHRRNALENRRRPRVQAFGHAAKTTDWHLHRCFSFLRSLCQRGSALEKRCEGREIQMERAPGRRRQAEERMN